MSAAIFDELQGHRHFAAVCFNRVWDYLELPQRDEAQVEAMLHAAHASMWHWLQVPDRTPRNESVGAWQLSRAYAVAGCAEEARHWARRSFEIAETHRLEPFYRGYAHEALARAALVAGCGAEAASELTRARELLVEIGKAEDRALLERDLERLAGETAR